MPQAKQLAGLTMTIINQGKGVADQSALKPVVA
jgi:hypothetical protein